MAVNARLRWSLISAAAVATGVAAFVAPEERAPIGPVKASERPTQVIQTAMREPRPLGDERPRRELIGAPRANLFATRSWAPPAPAQAEAPQPPPNPYRFIGTAVHDGAQKIFIALGDRVFEVKPGEKLEQGFRVQSATPQSVTLIYEPLDIPTTMALASPEQSMQAAAGASAPGPAK